MRKFLSCIAAISVGFSCSSSPSSMTSSYNFEKDSFSFANFDDSDDGGKMTAQLAIRMFGREAVCESMSTPDNCVVSAKAQNWINSVNQTLHYGHSEGMAVLSLLMSTGKIKPADFGAADVASLNFSNAKLRDEIAYWSATQNVPAVHADDQKFAAKDVITFLAKALKPGAEMYRLLVAVKGQTGFKAGHALVPFGYFQGEQDGQYFIRVYDNNMPGAEQRLEVNVKKNTWKYEGSYIAEIPRVYEGNAQNGNMLYFSPVSKREGILKAPFANDGSMAVSAQGSSILIEGDGSAVGIKDDGTIVENGGSVLPGSADCFCKFPNEIMNYALDPTKTKGPQTVVAKANDYTSSSSKVNVSGPGVSVSIEDANLQEQPVKVTVDKEKNTVTYQPNSNSNGTMTVILETSPGVAVKVSVVVDASAKSVTLDASDPNNVKVKVDNAEPNTKVAVEVEKVDKNGVQKSSTAGVTKEGKDAEISFSQDMMSATFNNNVTFEPCINRKKDPDEGDTDCGSFCNAMSKDSKWGDDARCNDGRTCKADADCKSNICANGVCAQPSCTDGRKNGNESDVDCGDLLKSNCICNAGKTCSFDAQCTKGTYCIAGTCAAPGSHTVTVVGVPRNYAFILTVNSDLEARNYTVLGTGAAQEVVQLQASKRLTVVANISDSAPIRCRFPGDTTTWSWLAPDAGTVTPGAVTLTCTRSSAPLMYTTNNTGCPDKISSDYLRESAPRVDFSYVTKSGALATSYFNAEYTAFNRSFIQDIYPNPDGGLSYSVTAVGGPKDIRGETIDGASTGKVYREACSVTQNGSGGFANSGDAVISLTCSCQAAVDAGVVSDIGKACTSDSNCNTDDCECGESSGSCANNSGKCGAGRTVAKTPTTDGVTPSATFTVPASCSQVRVFAWGAAGGAGSKGSGIGPPMQAQAGAGGYVGGIVNVQPGQQISLWVGEGGDRYSTANNSGIGSYFGVVARGGRGAMESLNINTSGGNGGGLTSFKYTGSPAVQFTVPAGAGAGSESFATEGAGGANAGSASTFSGGNAAQGSTAGGGGAGENGGLGGSGFNAGDPGQYGTLPSGLVSTLPSMGSAPKTGIYDYAKCSNDTAAAPLFGTKGGDGCIVIRCISP